MAQRTCQNSCVGYDGKSVLQDLALRRLQAITSAWQEKTVPARVEL